jgi:hypothetical protein
MSETIIRETSWKGQRLQKMRLANLLLDSIEKNPKTQIYGAIEYGQDVFTNNRGDKDPKINFEEDKNYADSKFSFQSHEVINTLVSFIDIWIEFEYSPNLRFGFYTTAGISKESKTDVVKTNSIELPDKPILELLSKADYSYTNLCSACVAFLKAEYQRQYSAKVKKGNLSTVNSLTNEQFSEFLKLIDWSFEQSDEVELKELVISKIKGSRLFNDRMIGKEEMIFSTICETIESKQGNSDLSDKFIHYSEVELVFKAAESGIQEKKPEDPVWEMWNTLTPSDKRNIKDKIDCVCKNFPTNKIELIARKVSRSLMEKEAASNNSFLSIRYRVYEECQDEIVKLITAGTSINESQIDEAIDKLTKKSIARINSLSSSYSYTHKDEKIIQGMILELFDSCFLAFD